MYAFNDWMAKNERSHIIIMNTVPNWIDKCNQNV